METKVYNAICDRVDRILKANGYIIAQVKDYKEVEDWYCGLKLGIKHVELWVNAKIVARDDHSVIDDKGTYHSIIKGEVKF